MIFEIFASSILLGAVFGAPKISYAPAKPCVPSQCKPPNCRCMSLDTPGGLHPKDIPQLVLLTFDDAVTVSNVPYYQRAFDGRKNPDGCPVQATYFVSHEYTDYSKIHQLHSRGHEIALHSISHEAQTAYWDELSVEGHREEFGDEADIIAHFADIPRADIKGLRVPFLQLGGNNSFRALKEVGLLYDSSWPTQNFVNPALWPYTLDYESNQDCPIGTCPKASLPGVWVQPMVNWLDDEGYTCAMVDACSHIPEDVDGLYEFMIRNFARHYDNNRAPFGFYVHAAWFIAEETRFEAYLKFLDYLRNLDDVYMVSVSRAIEWTRSPTRTSDLKKLWPDCPRTYVPTCKGRACELKKGEEYRYMTQCGATCPARYPWLGNPKGL